MIVKTRNITGNVWGEHDGGDVMLFRLTNDSGAYVEVTNYGATLVSVVVPDKFGKQENVILGFPGLRGYISDRCYIGSTIGRFANRINQGRFEMDGIAHELERNDGSNTNHGGASGFHARVFDYNVNDEGVAFTLQSQDGDGGYPGNLELKVQYAWSSLNELSVTYSATSDKKTVANFTNHAYFNLSPGRDIFDHRLTIEADDILETNERYIPTGRVVPAGNKSFKGESIYERSTVVDGRIIGLNTFYIFRSEKDSVAPVCILSDEHSGRKLEVFTTYPGVQLYTGDFLTSSERNNLTSFHKPFDGLCLECQYYPDSPNHAHFPSTVLKPGELYNQSIVYKFGIGK